jgi:hypothetical protein
MRAIVAGSAVALSAGGDGGSNAQMKAPWTDTCEKGHRPVWRHPRPDIAAAAAYEGKAQGCDLGIICQMADVHGRAVIATAGIAMDQQIATTVGSHMTQRHGGQFSCSRSGH